MSNLNKSQLMQRFQLRQTADYHPLTLKRVAHLEPAKLPKAAVLIGIVERAHGLNLILTRRADHLKHHPGQVSFPGGKFELFDQNLVETALRETFEEVGIEREKITILGQLPQLITRSQFAVTPFLAFICADYRSKIDKNEVAELFEMPLKLALDPNQLHKALFRFNQSNHQVFAMSYKNHFIWGMTAQIIAALQQQLVGS